MLNLFRKLPGLKLKGPLQTISFFALFYLYLWLMVKPHLIYHGGGLIMNFPAFFRDGEFFREFLSYPGGLVEYLSAFLAQLFYYSWAGALVITLQAWLICACVDYFLKTINTHHFRWLGFVPPVLLLAIYNQYTYHFATTVALLAALFFVCLYLKITLKRRAPGWAVFSVLSIILYIIASGAYLLFAALCAIYELLGVNRRQMSLVYLLSAAVVPYVMGVLVFNVTPTDAFSELLPLSWRVFDYESRREILIILYALYLFLPLAALALGTWEFFSNKKTEAALQTKSSSPITEVFSWVVKPPFLFVAAALAVYFSHNIERKTLFEVDYYASNRMWSQVLTAARRHPNSHFVIHTVNRALSNTGRLAYDMFSYPQHPHVLFLTSQAHLDVHWQRFDTYIDLGLINMAERSLSESMEIFGPRPTILKRLALVNMVKDNLDVAQIYLNALRKTFFHAHWADNYLEKLEQDSGLSSDSRIQHLRSIMMAQKHDSAVTQAGVNYEKLLSDLLYTNKENRIAFEYLMSWYMLTGQLEKLVQNLHHLDNFDYSQTPRLYEEAVLVYMFVTKKQFVQPGRPISRQSLQRFDGFMRASNRPGANRQIVFRELAKNYGDSYFFHYFYRLSRTKK